MAAAVGIIGAAAAAVIGGGGVVAAVASVAVSFALSAVSSWLAPKPSRPGSQALNSGLNVTSTQPDESIQIIYGKTRVGGARVYAESTSDGQYLHLVNVLAAHEVEEIGDIYLDDELVPLDGSGNATGTYEGYVRVRKHLGAYNQTADSALVAESSDWTTDHRLQGLAYIYVRLRWNADLFSQLPNISAVVKGRKVYDPREFSHDPANPATWEWTDNAALCLLDYFRGVPIRDASGALRRLYGVNALDSDIDLTEIAAEANICDETIVLAEGGTQPRYTCNGVVLGDTEPDEVVTTMLSSCAGMRVDSGGLLSLRTGAAQTATLSFDEGDLRGPMRVQPRRPLAELFNSIKGSYRGPDTNYQVADAPPLQDATLVSEDGKERWLDYQLPYTDTAAMAQRIQAIGLGENRRQTRLELPMTLSAIRMKAGDWFKFSSPRRGWDEKVFRCESLKISADEDENGVPYLGVDVVAQEMDTGVYAWESGDQVIVTPPPEPNLPNPIFVPAPTALAAEVTKYADLATLSATWSAPNGGPTVVYQFEYKAVGENLWQRLPELTEPEATLNLEIGRYDLRVRARATPIGGVSGWETLLNFEVGKPPLTPRVTGLELVGGGNENIFKDPDAQFRWRQGSVYSPGLDNPNGADAYQQELFFSGYLVQVIAPGGRLLRADTVVDPIFTYSLEMNQRDSLRELGSGPVREFTFVVQQIGKYGQETIYSTPQSVTVSNPPPAAVSGIAKKELTQNAWLDFSVPNDGDLAGTIVRADASPTFDPAAGEGTVVYDGNALNRAIFPVTAGETIYVSIAAYDVFGKDDLNWSNTIEITSQSISTAELDPAILDALETATAIEGSYVVRLDSNGRVTGFALVETGDVGDEVTAAFLVDKFLVGHPSVDGGAPQQVFVVEDGAVKLSTLIAEEVITDNLATVWADVGTLVGGRIIDDADNTKMEIDLVGKKIVITV